MPATAPAYSPKAWSGRRVAKARAYMARYLPTNCAQCGGAVTEEQAWTVGHRLPRSLRPDLMDDPSNWQVEHRRCSARTGSKVAAVKRAAEAQASDQGKRGVSVLRGGPQAGAATPCEHPGEAFPEGTSSEGRDPRAPEHPHFPHDLFPGVPAPLSFPPPHPDAVGTRLPEFQRWLTEVRGLPEDALRPWQAAVSHRLLEVDAEGRWCWGITGALLIVPRQQGKSTLMNLLASWMAEQGSMVVSAAPVLRQLWDLISPTMDWLDDPDAHPEPPLAVVSRRSDRPSIRFRESGGLWQGQAARLRLGVGSSVDSAFLDEVWDMEPDAVTRGLLPAMSARPNPFLLMASTADTEGSPLMKRWRAAATARPEAVALIEWGAPATSDWRDPATWAAASPAWTPDRARYLEAQIALVPELDFRTQYLNQEPRAVGISGWLELTGLAEAQPVPMGPVVAALDSDADGSWAVAWAWLHQGKVHLRVQPAGSSLRYAIGQVSSLQPTGVMVHRATQSRLSEPEWPVVAVSATQNLAATRAMEAMVKEGRLAYSGSLLEAQISHARLSPSGVLDHKASLGSVVGVQVAIWAAYAAETSSGQTPEVF